MSGGGDEMGKLVPPSGEALRTAIEVSTRSLERIARVVAPGGFVAALAREAEQAKRLEQQARTIAAQQATIRTQAGTIRVLEERLEERNLDTARLQAELRARRVARAEVPRDVTELIGWRKQRQLTQIEAARVLGLGPGAIAHAESQGWLGRKVQRALLCFTEEMGALSDSVPATTPTRRLGGG
jgi:uncharacterized coiled-coil protein SlyX